MKKILLVITIAISQNYNLDNCETDISENVPSFFHKYFQCVTALLSESGNYVNIYFNGLPPYNSWYWDINHLNYFPFESQGVGYYQNPGIISEFDLGF